MELRKSTYLTTLTPLRGIAALFVVIFHANLMMEPWMPPGYTHFVDNGWLWVDFFFILSGFIMCYVYGKQFAQGTTGSSFKKYIGARFSRIYPLYFITLIGATICALVILHKANKMDPFFVEILNVKKGFPASLVLVQSLNLFFTAPLNTPSWSLSTEWWVYMVFPFLVPVFYKVKSLGRITLLVFIIAFYIFVRNWMGPIEDIFTHKPGVGVIAKFGLFRCLAGFLLGMLVFSFYESKTGYSILKKSWVFILFFAGCLLALHFDTIDLVIIAFFPFILITAAYNHTGVKKFLDKRPLQRLGDWSFSIYMVHMPLIMLNWIYHIYQNPDYFKSFDSFPPPNYLRDVLYVTMLIAATLLIASLTYKYVEVPARNYLNRFLDTKRKKISPESLRV